MRSLQKVYRHRQHLCFRECEMVLENRKLVLFVGKPDGQSWLEAETVLMDRGKKRGKDKDVKKKKAKKTKVVEF